MRLLGRWPWPFLLLLFGSILATSGRVPQIAFAPELILFGFLPALMFEAAFSLDARAMVREVRWILLLGVVGAVAAAAITFLLLRALQFPGVESLLLAALLAATDPVSVFAVLRTSRAPERIRVVLQGESLVNDGVAIVLFVLVVGIVRGATPEATDLVVRFLRLSLGGLGLGTLIGFALIPLLRRLPPALSAVTTVVAAYGGYSLAEWADLSGLLTVIAAGVVIGSASRLQGRGLIDTFWRRAGFSVSSIVFLLMGLQVRLDQLLGIIGPLLLLVGSVFLARATMIAGLSAWARTTWPWHWQVAMVWAGLRGALSLALALSVPAQISGRSTILQLAFGFVFLSLALQGLSVRPVFRWLNLFR